MIKISDRLLLNAILREALTAKRHEAHYFHILICCLSMLRGELRHARNRRRRQKRRPEQPGEKEPSPRKLKDRSQIKFRDSTSLYDAGNTQYLPKQKEPFFDFCQIANFKYGQRMIMARISPPSAHTSIPPAAAGCYVKNPCSANLVSSVDHE